MAVIVDTNSYGDEVGLQAYADARGVTISASDLSILLINAMDYIESKQYSGSKYDEDQDLTFPLDITLDVDTEGEVPTAIINAQYVTALLIDSGESFFETVGQSVKKEKVDVIEVEYQDYTSSAKSYPQLDALLLPYLSNSNGSGSFTVVRG